MTNSSKLSNQADNPQSNQIVREFVLSQENLPLRLDQFLVQEFPWTSRAFWRGESLTTVLVNGKPAKKGQILSVGDLVKLLKIPQHPKYFIQKNSEIKIKAIYQDDSILIVNKAPGMATHPLKFDETNTLLNGVVAHFEEQYEWGRLSREAGLIHRLDNGTSGLLILARHRDVHQKLKDLQNADAIEKIYLAWVEGKISGHGKIEAPIAHHSKNKRKMYLPQMSEHKKYAARPAVTEYLVKAVFQKSISNESAKKQDYSLVELKIHRGQRHQIRIHLASLGHPIVGDMLYGASPLQGYPGHLLHAHKVRLIHPVTKKLIEVEAELPEGFWR